MHICFLRSFYGYKRCPLRCPFAKLPAVRPTQSARQQLLVAVVLNWLKHVQLAMIAIKAGGPVLSSPVLRCVIIVISGCNYDSTAL